MTYPVPLPEGTLLEGRYVLGAVSRTTAGGIIYTAFDKKLRIMVEVLEYLPTDCALSRGDDGCTITGEEDFTEKRERLLADGKERMHSAESNIYDVLSANGTAYLIHVAPRNNAEAAPAAAPVTEPVKTEAETAAETKIVTGILSCGDTAESETVTAEEPLSMTAEELLTAPELKKADPPRQKNEHLEESSGPSVRLLLTVLAAGIILLLVCCGIFLTSLFEIADLPGETESLLGVPYSEISVVTDEDWLVIGRGFHDGYAPGTVVAEEETKNGYRVLINGHTPAYIMPELTGMTAEGAVSLLNRTGFTNAAGLVQGQVTVNWVKTDDVPHGMVLEQTPAAGTIVKSSLVTITAADNPDSFSTGSASVMADLTGKQYSEAAGTHTLLVSDRIVSDKPAGEILAQYPAAGTSYRKNAPCYVVVSLGSRESAVPDIQFMTLEEAQKILYRCGLSFTVEYAISSHIQTGLVSAQSPAAGQSIPYGETVTLTVSGEGTWNPGPQIQNELTSVVLDIGDTCTMELGSGLETQYYSTAPDVVSVTDQGLVTALSAGSAVVSASTGGQTAVMFIQVSYENRLPCTITGAVGEKISLPALGDAAETGTVWYADEAMVSISEKGVLTGKKAGETLVRGEKGGRVSLYLVKLEDAEKEKVYVTIPKATASDKTKMQSALTKAGLTCTFLEEYNDADAGTILRIQYTGYSDDSNYYFTEGTAVTLIVSRGQPAVSSIAIAEKPKKLEYAVGEKLNTDGLSLKVVYADKSEEIITKGFTVSYDFSSPGRKTVAVSYEQRKTSFAVEVVNKGPVKAEIVTLPTKTTYDLKESLNTAGLKVKVTYGDGSTKLFTTGFTTSYSFDKAGTSRVTVTVEGVSAYFDVTVAEKKVRSLKVEKMPDKTVYQVGESLNTSGMTLSVNYTDGTTKTVYSGWSTSADLTGTGRKTVTVTYGGKTTTFTIQVEEAAVSAIRIVSQPQRLTYTTDEEIDLTGLELSVTRGGKSTTVTWPDNGITWEGDLNRTGERQITIYYGGKSAVLKVSVTEPAIRYLTVLVLPDRTAYTTEEELDPAGMVLEAEYDNGKTKRITEGYRLFYDFSEPGEVLVNVTYEGVMAHFFVTVEEAEELFVLPTDAITLRKGEDAVLTFRYNGSRHNRVTCEVSDPEVLEVSSTTGGLYLFALKEGVCTITLSDGTARAVCTVTVEASGADPNQPAVQFSVRVGHQAADLFMPVIALSSDKVSEEPVPVSIIVRYDPDKLIAADTGVLAEGLAVMEASEGIIVISGSVQLPAKGELDAVYIMFVGEDPTAFTVSVS
ncbi:MAG: bacterial Ig-like domain-containing protein [Clostridia bacterium]|nr:bacterial Ig-like domain-containing protein [Clostridia bacterium]